MNYLGERILEDVGKLKRVRDRVVDWVLLESEANTSKGFGGSLIERLQRLLGPKWQPPEVNTWNDAWFEAHSIFLYETFL